MVKASELPLYSQALAFVGNSFLKPMTQTSSLGLMPEFWEEFPLFGNEQVEQAVLALFTFAQNDQDHDIDQRAHETACEFTELFVGPSLPAAAPWETTYDEGYQGTGFGQATFEMRHLLREAGLEVSGDFNQYADHIGIELLYAAALCEQSPEKLPDFIEGRLLKWSGKLFTAIEKAKPEGFYARLGRLTTALLECGC